MMQPTRTQQLGLLLMLAVLVGARAASARSRAR